MDPGPTPDGFQEPVITAQVVSRPSIQTPRRKSRGLGLIVVFVLLLALAGSMLLNVAMFGQSLLGRLDTGDAVREESLPLFPHGKDKIAVISIEGVIVSGEGFVKRQIDRAAEDEDVKAVVLRVNSPGGTVSGSDYIYHHLKKLAQKKKMVVSMGGIAASGGYYVAMAVGHTPDAIFAEPTTSTGSIGVKIPHYDFSKLLAKWGVQEDTIASHQLKTMGSLAKPMTEQEREIFQGLVDDSFNRFKEIVKLGRAKFQEDPQALDKLATGQLFTARQALEHGLVDRIGFVEDAIDRAIEVAGLDAEDVRVVKYRPEPTLANLLLGAEAPRRDLDLAALLEMTTPRAYYLYTWLPAIASSRE